MLRLLRLYLRVAPGLTVALLAGVLLAGVLVPALALASGALVDRLAHGRDPWPMLAAIAGLFLLQRLLAPVQQVVGPALSRRVVEAVNERVMRAMADPPGLAHVEDSATHDRLARALGQITGITPGSAAARLGWVWRERLQGGLSLALVFAWKWWAALALAVAAALTFRASRWHWDQVTLVIYGRTEKLRRAYYLRKLAFSGKMAKETRVFGLAGWLVDHYRQGWLAVMEAIWRKRREGWLVALGLFGGLALLEGGALAMLMREALAGQVSVGQVVTLLGAIAAAGVLGVFHDGHHQLVEARRTLDEIDTLERLTAPASGVVGGSDPADGLPRRELRLEAVSFAYPGTTQPVFQGLDLTIEAGRSLAIVGDNGAGKTTLVKLLARLYDPSAGRITADGTDLRQLDPRAWHKRVAAIFQDYVQFELTARDNVVFGALERRDDRAALELAAEQAGASPIVARLPDGWDTPLGRQFSKGAELSGGQWQRLALTRALFAVRAGAGLLVLDEPTAALDVRGEAEVYERFLELTRGITTIVISHRFSTVRRADRIVVLEGGRVIEDGTHADLVGRGGRYATMYKLQAARFQEPALEEGHG